MPTEAEIPRGARRNFVEQLFSLYKKARRPGLREISRAIPDDAPGTASTETIRRILLGHTVPAHWETVDAVLTALCQLAGVDPDADIGDGYDDRGSLRDLVEGAWHEALDNPDRRDLPGSPELTGMELIQRELGEQDPWALDARGSYADEPPF
jgi:hypothetical protein